MAPTDNRTHIAPQADGVTPITPHFPVLRQMSSMVTGEVGIILIGCAAVAPFAARFWKPLLWILWTPFLIAAAHVVCIEMENWIARLRWAKTFRIQIPPRKAIEMIAAQPGRFVLHCKHYGGFDRSRLSPATLMEDVQSKDMIAVFPASRRVLRKAKEVGMPIQSY